MKNQNIVDSIGSKEYIELRLKCLSPFIACASKHGIEKDEIIRHAEKAWEFAVNGVPKN